MKKTFQVAALSVAISMGCGQQGAKEQPAVEVKEVQQVAQPQPTAPVAQASPNVLFIAQSEFKADDRGMYTVPDASVMLIARKRGDRFRVERVEDRDSNVFHKAMAYGQEGILTIGGNDAKLKLWRENEGRYSAEVLWEPTFGGKHNRLRDFELADLNGDGADDIAIATHDQGVVAVVWRRGDKWEPQEFDRQADTFVHEIEIGDLDGDGKKEIYATPSQPNDLSAKYQGGKIVRYVYNGKGFEKKEVVNLTTRHVKEVLVADVDGDGRDELYAALEAVTDGPTIKQPVSIRRYDFKGGQYVEQMVTELQDRFCRFLVAGDIDNDGQTELVAAAFTAGVWVMEITDSGWSALQIDDKSGGFEHAAYITDIENDGVQELYVADDKNGLINRYDYKDGSYQKTLVTKRLVASQAMTWNITAAKF